MMIILDDHLERVAHQVVFYEDILKVVQTINNKYAVCGGYLSIDIYS